MKRDRRFSHPSPLPELPLLWLGVAGAVLAAMAVLMFFLVKSWVNVGSGEVAIFVKKTGRDLPPGAVVAVDRMIDGKEVKAREFKGVQLDQLSEGWHFRNYYTWERITGPEYTRKITIPAGECRVLVRLFGDPLPPGEILARKENQKGIVPGVLEPGTHAINMYAYDVVPGKVVRIPNGFVGVVLLKAGRMPRNPNVFLVEEGERGIQKKTYSEGTYYINPFEKEIEIIDMRSQIYQLSEKKAESARRFVGKPITFPSKDGFLITLKGKIEWRIDPARVAEVYVKYVDDRKGPNRVIRCIVEKVILPNTRSFVRIYGSMEEARNFIEGSTRTEFQKRLYTDLKEQCFKEGIIIKNVSITEMKPPREIAELIKRREEARLLKAKYLKEKEREKEEKKLAMEKRLQERSRRVKEIEAEMAVRKTRAEQDKEVAIVEAKKMLSVAELRLEAARKRALAVRAKGEAEADVIRYNNLAEASGIVKAVEAFGKGESYVRYLFLKKVAPGFLYVLANTEGPFIKIFEELFVEEEGKK